MRKLLLTLAQISVLAGAVLYGLGWLFCLRFFSKLHVTPEEAGITFPFVVVRVALALLVAILVLAILAFLLGQLDRARELYGSESLVIHQRPFLVVFTVWQILLLLLELAIVLRLHPWTRKSPAIKIGGTFAIVAAALIFLILAGIGMLRWVKYNAGVPVTIDRPLIATLSGLLTLILLGYAALYGAGFAVQQVRAGSELAFFGFRIEKVVVSPTTTQALPPSLLDTGCIYLLGEHEGIYSLLDIRTSNVLFASAQTVVLTKAPRLPSCQLR
jgi:hypothetical protein